MSKVARRTLLIFSSIILSIALLLLGVTAFIGIYSHKNINSDADSILFEMTRGGSVTKYYYDSSGNLNPTLDTYKPLEYEVGYYSENEKIWYYEEEICDFLKKGFIAVEDRGFYEHSGFDLKRTAYAAANSLFHFKNTFGASTITQQVIKNISGDNGVNIKRKFNEILRAVNLERKYEKDEILEVYLNIVPMGENIIGVGLAARNYFGKEPGELTAAESATLIGITNAPTRYNPHDNPYACLKKRNDVLFAMYDFGVIDEEEYTKAKEEPLKVQDKPDSESKICSWFAETVNSDVIEALVNELDMSRSLAEQLVMGGGLSIYTTVDPMVQSALEEYFENESNFSKKVNDGLDFSMVVCDSKNSNLLGIIGAVGKKSGNRVLNLATSPHTPGSALKPLALYAPLINQKKINYATVFDDVPQDFLNKGGALLEYPKNYPAVYQGLTTVKDAVRLSKNTVAVKLYGMLGPEEIYYNLKNNFGFDTLLRRRPTDSGGILTDLAPSPLALGQLTYGVSLKKLTEAYTVFPSEGTLSQGRSFIAVYDSLGNLLLENRESSKKVFRPEAARIMNSLLMNVTEDGTARKITLKNTVDTAGKTGTSGEDKDRLFVGYTPYYTAGIWCGYRNGGESIGSTSPTHIKIWDDVMTRIHNERLRDISDENIESFSYKGLKRLSFCKDSGKLFCPDCSLDPRGNRMDYGYFEPSFIPFGKCDRHVVVEYDTEAGKPADEDSLEENIKLVALLRVEGREFPKKIFIADDEYVLRERNEEELTDTENKFSLFSKASSDAQDKEKKKKHRPTTLY